MKQIIGLLLLGVIFSSCVKTNITPKAKVYTSIEGSWKLEQLSIDYSCTFEIIKGDMNYPYYPSNVKGIYKGIAFSYLGVSISQGLIVYPDKAMGMLLPTLNNMVTITGILPNPTFTELNAGSGDINGTHFKLPITIKRQ